MTVDLDIVSSFILVVEREDNMELITISEVSKTFNVSTRMLRYYEKIGLLTSLKKEDYAYRVYDEKSILQLQQIILLRKLRVSLKQIGVIFSNPDAKTIVDIFTQNLNEINDEMTALSTVRIVLGKFVDELRIQSKLSLEKVLFSDEVVLEAINSLSLSKISFKEERSMDDLHKANEVLTVLTNVRIIYLPPCTVVSSHYIGENPEDVAGKMMDKFVESVRLQNIKSDLRMYGFNNPSPSGSETYGYEFWVTVSDGLDIVEPLEKKKFEGGLYAAHCIKIGDFHEWQFLDDWVKNSKEYEYDEREPHGMGGCLEEHLNAYTYFDNSEDFTQVDLLMPVRKK